MERVVTLSEVRDRDSIQMYHKFLNQKNKKQPMSGSQDPTETLGYQGNVSEARILFEKLYKKKADL